STKISSFSLKSEFAYNRIQVPQNNLESFGSRQWGGFVDMSYQMFKGDVLQYQNTLINTVLRLEMIEYNIGTFSATGFKIYDEIYGFTFGFSIKLNGLTIIKANYKLNWS